ncbi:MULTISPECIES: hypothetical protein [unclassified Synechococcus]|uniref:hypothetical protein n=1 Tax=unclassified Synechococcus TaxID=2626047 RepID=UPI0020005DA4|nr:hypothetical protein [Synechococcus sp. A10-1-5-1]UPM49461.1 hypothetical protein MY494_08935 [Synechococcus sp. A10-1-5-1]
MTAPSSSCTNRPGRAMVSSDSFTARKEQALVILLSQQLADAQIGRADAHASQSLWDEVAELDIDPDRIIHLLYGGEEVSDRAALKDRDDSWLSAQQMSPERGWSLQRLHLRRPRRPQIALNPV